MTALLAADPSAWTESELDAVVFRNADSIAKTLGWVSYHVLHSKGSKHGYPDRTLYRDRVIFAELKSAKGKPTDDQVRWLDGLAKAGAEVYLWRPDDCDEIARILGARWSPTHGPMADGTWRLQRWERIGDVTSVRESFAPASLWIPGRGRQDGAVG